MNLCKNFSVGTNGDRLPRDPLAACGKGALHSVLKPAAAGHLHAEDGDAPHVIVGKELRELIGVIPFVKLGATDEGNAPLHKVPMDVTVGISGAVGGNEKLGTVKVGRVYGNQLDLARPLSKLTVHSLVSARRFSSAYRLGGISPQGFGLCAGASTGKRRGNPFFGFRGRDGCLVVGRGFSYLKGDGIHGTSGEAIPQAVAIILAGELGLAVYHFDGAFVAGGGASAATVASFFIDCDDLSEHFFVSSLLL